MQFNEKNTIAKTLESRKDATTNFEGGIAFSVDPKMELFLRSSSAMIGSPKYYVDADKSTNELIDLIHKVGENDPEFVLKLALYARENLYLRSLPVFMVVELINHVKDIPNAQHWVASVIQRADEITEMLSYQFSVNKRESKPELRIPMSIKHGIANAFGKFDAYQLSKYAGDGNVVSMRRAMFLTHPTPKTPDQIALYQKIADATLEPAKVWETSIMVDGSDKESWEKILPSMGYMAILRNLRNFIISNVDTSMYVPRISDGDFVRKSKQFPFRFYSAWKTVEAIPKTGITQHGKKFAINVEDVPYVMKGIEKALNESVANVPKMSGITFVAIDVSDSMNSPISRKHTLLRRVVYNANTFDQIREEQRRSVTRKEIAALFGAIVNQRSERAITSVFGEDFATVNMSSGDILENMNKVLRSRVGFSTNAWKAIDFLNTTKKKVDRIVIFSDEVVYDSVVALYGNRSRSLIDELVKYQRNVNPDVYVYSVDLAGYGFSSIPVDTKNTAKIAGFSDKIFNYMALFETDRRTMLNDIENYQYH